MSFLDAVRELDPWDEPPPLPPQRDILLPEPLPPPTPERAPREEQDLWLALLDIDRQCAKEGMPPISDWWLENLCAFYKGGFRRFCARVGRRGGKTSTIIKCAVAEVLYGRYTVPPNDIGDFIFISKDREDVRDKLLKTSKVLDALKIEYHPTKDELVLAHYPVRMKSVVATIAGVVSKTAIGIFEDEVALWRDAASGANPAKEILANLRPSMITQPGAHEYMVSAPWGCDDVHYHAIEEGTTKKQYVCIAPTWEANPTVTKEECQEEEPDPVICDRSYGAIPMSAGTGTYFDSRLIENITEDIPETLGSKEHFHVAAVDLAFSNDRAALSIGRLEETVSRQVYSKEVTPSTGVPVVLAVIDDFLEDMVKYKVTTCMADVHYRELLRERAYPKGISILNAPPPTTVYPHVKRKMGEGRAKLLPDKTQRSQFLSVMGVYSAGKKLTILLPKGKNGHCDLVSATTLMLYMDYAFENQPEPPKLTEEEKMFARTLKQQRKENEETHYEDM